MWHSCSWKGWWTCGKRAGDGVQLTAWRRASADKECKEVTYRAGGVEAGDKVPRAVEAHLQDRCQHRQHVLGRLLRVVTDVEGHVSDLLRLRNLRSGCHCSTA